MFERVKPFENGVPLDPWDDKMLAYFCTRESEAGGNLTYMLFFK
jgi:hypothetical protein